MFDEFRAGPRMRGLFMGLKTGVPVLAHWIETLTMDGIADLGDRALIVNRKLLIRILVTGIAARGGAGTGRIPSIISTPYAAVPPITYHV